MSISFQTFLKAYKYMYVCVYLFSYKIRIILLVKTLFENCVIFPLCLYHNLFNPQLCDIWIVFLVFQFQKVAIHCHRYIFGQRIIFPEVLLLGHHMPDCSLDTFIGFYSRSQKQRTSARVLDFINQ